MFKHLLALALVLGSLNSFSQKNIDLLSIANLSGFSHVDVFINCETCKEQSSNQLEVYNLNEAGNITSRNSLENGKINGLTNFYWNKGLLTRLENYSTFAVDMEKGIQIWLEDSLSNEIRFFYNDQNSIIRTVFLDGNNRFLSSEIIIEYDSLNRIVSENQTYFKDNTIFMGFKANSTEMIELEQSKRNVTKQIKYSYESDTTTLSYFVDDVLTGSGKVVFSSDNKRRIYEETKTTSGIVLFRSIYYFDTDSKLYKIEAQLSGVNGFGDNSDFSAENIVYKFDKQVKLTSQTMSNNGKLTRTYYFKYRN
jgi:hypothetical protein